MFFLKPAPFYRKFQNNFGEGNQIISYFIDHHISYISSFPNKSDFRISDKKKQQKNIPCILVKALETLKKTSFCTR